MKKLELGFGNFELHQETVIAHIDKGVHFDKRCNRRLINELDAYYGADTPLSIIFVHKNYHSIDPFVFIRGIFNKNICALAIVELLELPTSTDFIIQRFYKNGKVKSFTNLELAQQWCDAQLMNYLWSNNDILLQA